MEGLRMLREAFPPSLGQLYISGCLHLRRQRFEEKGDYWTLTWSIPNVWIYEDVDEYDESEMNDPTVYCVPSVFILSHIQDCSTNTTTLSAALPNNGLTWKVASRFNKLMKNGGVHKSIVVAGLQL
ncbi:hypothetical protein SLEP1_g55457 [Rubroshorea leprosula]|uniref:Uncharacterized protein n=1 Tax=Rubroshorea leprosula TaxID=152421 RepID=A0AAV5MIM1_9ROSI|nr:hypothetical protein SLEP1_g55457 [Rubroshorea leprosula]